jgi:hypothetical protein
MPMPRRIFAAPALLAAFSLTATPAAAVELPTSQKVEVHAASNYGWGWRQGHRYRHRGRTTAGDVIGAVLVLGTIAAVANAAAKAERNRGYPYPNRYPAPPYPERRGDYRPEVPRGIEGAADMCLREVERDARAREVTRVERNASGWLVSGEMADGAPFTCSIGADGRIENIEVGGRARLGDFEARSEDEGEAYRSAEVEAEGGPQPDYPGGPLPGDAGEDEAEPES